MASEKLPVQLACRVLGVSQSGYYDWHTRPPSTRFLRHVWLTEQIQVVHRGHVRHLRLPPGARRAMPRARHSRRTWCGGAADAPGRAGRPPRPQAPPAPARHRLRRRPRRPQLQHQPDELWVTDITEHPTREGKLYCAVVLDVHSRRVVGWSIDATQTAALATNALSMAIANRSPRPDSGTVIDFDHGVQFTSWAFTRRAQDSGLVPSMGSIGDCYDNAVIESFWGRVQTELLNRRRWRTRIELANALFEYLEIFHNRRRRHSALGMLTPIEYEKLTTTATA